MISVLKALSASGSELLGLLIDDWLLFFGTVVAIAASAGLAEGVSGNRLVAGLVLFCGLWTAMLVSLTRAARGYRLKLESLSSPTGGHVSVQESS